MYSAAGEFTALLVLDSVMKEWGWGMRKKMMEDGEKAGE